MSIKTLSCFLACLLLMTICAWSLAAAQETEEEQSEPQAQEESQDEKKPEVTREGQQVPEEVAETGKVPVMVEYQDLDSLGRRLVFNIRERFNSSDLFRLSGYQEQKLKIVISSQEEFPSRPGLSSIYSIVWTFSYGEDVLDNYLQTEVGQISSQGLRDLAEDLVAKTDRIYSEYSYLFEEE
ncbi:MAG: hypothetical protein ACLFMQ_05430 [Desulfohalobiaceae bacterium]